MKLDDLLYAFRNDEQVECKGCGRVHPFFTREEKVLLVTKDDDGPKLGPKVTASTVEVMQEIERVGVAVGWRG